MGWEGGWGEGGGVFDTIGGLRVKSRGGGVERLLHTYEAIDVMSTYLGLLVKRLVGKA